MGDQQVDGFTLVKHSFISKLWMIGSLLRLNIEAGPQTERSFGHSARRSFIGKPCLVGQSVLWISHKRDIFWLVVWNILYIFHILGMSSSQLTFIFFRGVETTNQNFIFTIIHFKKRPWADHHCFSWYQLTKLLWFPDLDGGTDKIKKKQVITYVACV